MLHKLSFGDTTDPLYEATARMQLTGSIEVSSGGGSRSTYQLSILEPDSKTSEETPTRTLITHKTNFTKNNIFLIEI